MNKIHMGKRAARDDFYDKWLDAEPPRHYAQITLVVLDHAPLLAHPRLARAVYDVVRATDSNAPGRVWGALVMPEMARVIVGPGDALALDAYITAIKARAAERVLPIIQRADDETLDAVLRYSPVWGGAIYRVWQPGYHFQTLWSEAQLSNALYALAQRPVEVGLARSPNEWPWLWLGAG